MFCLALGARIAGEISVNWTIKRSDEDKEKFQKLKIILAVGIVFAIVFGIVTRSVLLPILTIAVLFASTSEFFLGKKYLLEEKGAKAGMAEMPWGSVKSVHIMPNTIFLSPFEAESKLDAFRGVKLNIQNVSMESVLEYIRQHVGKDVRFLGE